MDVFSLAQSINVPTAALGAVGGVLGSVTSLAVWKAVRGWRWRRQSRREVARMIARFNAKAAAAERHERLEAARLQKEFIQVVTAQLPLIVKALEAGGQKSEDVA